MENVLDMNFRVVGNSYRRVAWPRRRLRGGALDFFGRPVRLRLKGNSVKIVGGLGKFGSVRLRRKVECSHCPCIAAAAQEHRIEAGLTFKYTMSPK